MRKTLGVLSIVLLGGCATNHYETAYANHHDTLAEFRVQASPVLDSILEGKTDPVEGFASLEGIARATRPDDTELRGVFRSATDYFGKAKYGEITYEEATQKFADATTRWENSQHETLQYYGRRDLEARGRAEAFGNLLTVVAGALIINAASNHYQGQYIQPQYNYTAPMIYVNPYIRSDGTFVDGHFRTAPNHTCLDNLSGCR